MEKEILAQLIKNSSQTVVEIANKVGASRQTVAKTILRMKAQGLIDSFTVRLNPEKFGLGTKAYVLLQEDPKVELRKEDEAKIKQFSQVTEFYRLFGRYSAVLEILVKDSKELTDLIKKIHKLKGVRETETFIVHSSVKNEPEAPFIRILKAEKAR